MSKRDRTMWDGVEGGTWILAPDGELIFRPVGSQERLSPSPEQEKRVRRRFESRSRSSKQRRVRDQLMRDLGLVKVRGSVSGSTYWE